MQNCILRHRERISNWGFFTCMMPNFLFICNHNINDRERVNKKLLDTSVLLKNENINLINLITNYDERIYSRNVQR